MSAELEALQSADFDWTTHIDSIWRDLPFNVPEFQEDLRKEALLKLERLFVKGSQQSPLGLVLVGSGGSGKTHMLSLLRAAAQQRGALFVLIDMTDVRDFWETTLLGYTRSLSQHCNGDTTQKAVVMRKLVDLAATKAKYEQVSRGKPPGLINTCNLLIDALRKQHTQLQDHQDVLRALALYCNDDPHLNDLGWKWLLGVGMDDDERMKHGFQRPNAPPREIVRGLSFLMSMAAPTLLALDQLDAIVAELHLAAGAGAAGEAPTNERSTSARAIIQGIAKGLIALHDTTARTQSVVACLERTWSALDKHVLVTVRDRFFPPLFLRPIVEAEQVRRLVELRLTTAYSQFSVQPEYASYPYPPEFFERLSGSSPREVLKRCDEHRWDCVRAGRVFLPKPQPDAGPGPVPPLGAFTALRTQFQTALSATPIEKLLNDEDEESLDTLMETACRALSLEVRVPDDVDVKVDLDFVGSNASVPLHARLRVIYHSEAERERHYAVRFLQKTHHLAFQARIKAAMTASGIDHDLGFRRLVVFRRGPIPSGSGTRKLVEEFNARGGAIVEPSLDDLRRLWALAQLMPRGQESPDVRDWLRHEPIVSQLACFRSAASYLFDDIQRRSRLPEPEPVPKPDPQGGNGKITPKPQPAGTATPDGQLYIGMKLIGSTAKEPLSIPLSNLAKHTVILAGAGSGKTVLVRRIIEEVALLGVPSIVLDGANDLARLGDPWPEPPASFNDEDRAKEKRYRAQAEVVIWTPGRESGNPLQFDPMPDFSEVGADPDELQAALDMARSSLEPLLNVGKSGGKKSGILAGALKYFASIGGGSLQEFVDMLKDLPADANAGFKKADELACDMGESILAAMQTNPLLRGKGAALDVGRLLTAKAPGKTRISVVNLSGLPGLLAQQQFIDQLCTTLFSWIKKHPPKERPLQGLLIVDEARDFVPSGKSVPGKDNLIRLAAQARKYGLGIVFATQAPKSIDHNVIANCSSQFFGKANSPAAIETVQDQLRQRGAGGADIAKLPKGTFYAYSEGLSAPVKVQTSLCLSHHPSSPPEESEIVARAAASRKLA